MSLKTATRSLGFDKTTSFDTQVDDVGEFGLLNVIAGPKAGKTRLILEYSPDPVGYLNTDHSERGAIQRAIRAGRKIVPSRYVYKSHKDSSTDRIKARAAAAFKQWCVDYKALLANDKIRTIGIDGGTSVKEMVSLAAFGGPKPPSGKVSQFLYAEVNRRMSSLILAGKNCGKNVIWLHRPKELYRANKPTGIIVAKGFDEIGFEAEATIMLTRSADEFSATIVDSRFNPHAVGVELTDEDITLENIMEQVFNAEATEKDKGESADETADEDDDEEEDD